jgi:predicted P-loop ATPase
MEDQTINIATGMSAKSRKWNNKSMLWSDFAAKLSQEHKTNETYKEFMASTKEEQSKIKDVGGYVGGYLRGGKRNPENVMHRQVATLDIDFAHLDFWEDFTFQFDCAAIIHGTHKHSDLTPRYRLVLPLSREATPDEYVAVSRKIAGLLGIELFDNTTFETNRLMFWPSNPKDVNYYFKEQKGEFIDVDEVLGMYIDWKDTSLWPTADRKIREIGEQAKKLEEPTLKRGIVGAFCRAFNIPEAIEEFLSEQYVATDDDKRYTYTKGSTAAGLMVYDDTHAYSHHGTDPCGGKSSNSFDLVRIHLFGHLDGDNPNGTQKAKSYAAMEDFARSDKKVKQTLANETLENARYDFSEDFGEIENVEGDNESNEWMLELTVDSKGKYLSTSSNINTILANDLRLKNTFKRNDFDCKRYIFKSLPWRKITNEEPIKDVDYSGIRNYIESIYGISGTLKIDDSLALEFQKQSYHPIKDYLRSVKWDSVERLDTLTIDYFGAKDNIYTREAIRKTLVAAVARVFNPGCKYDVVLTLVGEQGTNKSSFFKKLGKQWFSDTFMTVQGKEALEQIQGAWIIEMAELAGLRKAEVETIKHFISKQEDSFRMAYAHTSETYKRQCIFVGTTNKKDFLNDITGNRRFAPIEVVKTRVKKDVWKELDDEVDQIWAEAMMLFKAKEPLFFSAAAEAIANAEQRKHSETDERKGIIEEYLNTKLPTDWATLDIYERQDVLALVKKDKGTVRDFVCMAEVWCECLGKNKEDMTRYNTREINDVMKSLEEWEYHATTKNFALYGKQKYYSRR